MNAASILVLLNSIGRVLKSIPILLYQLSLIDLLCYLGLYSICTFYIENKFLIVYTFINVYVSPTSAKRP